MKNMFIRFATAHADEAVVCNIRQFINIFLYRCQNVKKPNCMHKIV